MNNVNIQESHINNVGLSIVSKYMTQWNDIFIQK